MPDLTLLYVVVFLALAFDYINGFHDTANAIATSVSTRALEPQYAVMLAAVLNFAGALYSTGVAKTIGGDLVKSASLVSQPVIISALIGAIVWNLITWWLGIPSSSSHALVGGVLGAVVVGAGFEAINFIGVERIFLSLVLSPLIAMAGGYIIMIALLWMFGRQEPGKLNSGFKKMQLLSASMMSFSHGSNDAQKAMGIITLALLSSGQIATLEVPFWVKLSCAMAMALGTAAGGWKIIKTMGGKIFKLEPISGFAADLNSSLVIFAATNLHLPVSTTHVVSGSIMGVGSSKRISAVRWGVAQQMLFAWVLTIPFSAVTSALMYKVLKLFM
ncbi:MULTISPECIES: inorganic phosphate transporter [Sporomusa]|jgi:PiT family inorganic phosphate transporter|uniref:inorganic phosphate transporter n=1 Tax=Sporomusa TaxID=2375 RepID=UPI001665543C|nr:MULTISPECIES: inorganic phosphate transporter [Sporomusa]MCM0761271.1 inorganic phosphate transporter [Sporomusa sphaeroides DSM 2875]HML32717.1 inorganic phosphate transporter [Sporomusa sphaeroides]